MQHSSQFSRCLPYRYRWTFKPHARADPCNIPDYTTTFRTYVPLGKSLVQRSEDIRLSMEQTPTRKMAACPNNPGPAS